MASFPYQEQSLVFRLVDHRGKWQSLQWHWRHKPIRLRQSYGQRFFFICDDVISAILRPPRQTEYHQSRVTSQFSARDFGLTTRTMAELSHGTALLFWQTAQKPEMLTVWCASLHRRSAWCRGIRTTSTWPHFRGLYEHVSGATGKYISQFWFVFFF